MDPEKSMLLVKKGDLAYHTHPDIGYQYVNLYFNNREICELTEVHLVRPTVNSFFVHPNSTIDEMLKIGYVQKLY